MQQFGVYRFSDTDARGQTSLIIVLQANAANHLGAIIAAPLKSPQDAKLPILHVPVVVNGASFFVRVNELAAVQPKKLGAFVTDLSAHEATFKRAIDFLFFGI